MLIQPKTVGDVNAHIQELVEREKLENQGEGSDEEDDEAWKCINSNLFDFFLFDDLLIFQASYLFK